MKTRKDRCMKALRLGFAMLFCLPALDAGIAQNLPTEQRGMVFARTNCAQCHSIDPVGPSPLPLAPPFRELHKRYPVETLEEALAEGIRTGHPSMPEFRLEPDQIGDLIAFLKSLE